ncbi:BTAD domain-containing putative transcriptional regulator [Actinophytocola sediminis]
MTVYRSGYRIRALEAFHTLRRNMISEFGLEPSRKSTSYQAALPSIPRWTRWR